MDAIASRIIKARQYAAERDERLWVNSLQVRFTARTLITAFLMIRVPGIVIAKSFNAEASVPT